MKEFQPYLEGQDSVSRRPFELEPEDKIAELEDKKAELEEAKEAALANIVIETRKKKKYKKEEESEALELEIPEHGQLRKIEFVKGDKNKFVFSYKDQNGREVVVSPGDLIADMQWGVYYDLNHEIKSQAHRREYNKFRQQYVEAFYQQQIAEVETEEALINLLEIEHVEDRDYYLAEAYKNVYQALQEHKQGRENMQAGFLLEKMINGLLTKISVDLGAKYGFEVEQASVVDDVELKVDLIIKFPDKNRGVGVEETKKTKGIQLTLIRENDAKFARKKEQVARVKESIGQGKGLPVDDLVLIQVGVDNAEISDTYEKWAKMGKPTSGPEKLLKNQMIINEFLAKIFAETEFDFNDNPQFKNELWEYFEGK